MYRELELECTWHLVKEQVGDDFTPGVREYVVIDEVFVIDGHGWRFGNIIDVFTHEQLRDMAEEIYSENYG